MKRHLFMAMATWIAWSGVGPSFAAAQSYQLGTYGPPQIHQKPAVSPYVNMGIGGVGGGATAYYGIVRPEVDAGRTFNQLQFGLNQLQTGVANPGNLAQQGPNALGGLQTGHSVTYNNYQRFFPLTYGTVSGMQGQGGYGAPGYGQTGFGQTGFGQAGFGAGGMGGTQQNRTFQSGMMGPVILR